MAQVQLNTHQTRTDKQLRCVSVCSLGMKAVKKTLPSIKLAQPNTLVEPTAKQCIVICNTCVHMAWIGTQQVSWCTVNNLRLCST
jgi:hypothetical protein